MIIAIRSPKSNPRANATPAARWKGAGTRHAASETVSESVDAVDKSEKVARLLVGADQKMLSVVERQRAKGDSPRAAAERLGLLV